MAALSAVISTLDAAEAEYVVVGSVAATAWGVVRTTRDADLVAVLSSAALDDVIDRLAHGGLYVPIEEARRSASGGSFNVLHTEGGGKVDVFIPASDDVFTRSLLSRRVGSEVLGITTWVATAEDIVIAKLAWRRESRSEVQWRDCVEIAATNDLDRDYMMHWATTMDVSDDLEELLGPS